MTKEQDPIWNYFRPIVKGAKGSRVECGLCGKQLTYVIRNGPRNLKSHIKHAHKDIQELLDLGIPKMESKRVPKSVIPKSHYRKPPSSSIVPKVIPRSSDSSSYISNTSAISNNTIPTEEDNGNNKLSDKANPTDAIIAALQKVCEAIDLLPMKLQKVLQSDE